MNGWNIKIKWEIENEINGKYANTIQQELLKD